MTADRSKQRAWVIGASSDIGRSIAVRLARSGCDVVVFGRDRSALEETAAACRSASAAVEVVGLDLTSPDAMAVLQQWCDDLPADHVVWAAGVFDWSPADVADTATWDHLVEVNLTAAMRVTRVVLPGLAAAGAGSLVFVASLAGLDIFANNAAYVASKHGRLRSRVRCSWTCEIAV
jgi:short-subunit dehydrogenase